ncbi:MAG: diguanylate cyclase domain-containing protein [Geitlerinemataceae cyanobacterium]
MPTNFERSLSAHLLPDGLCYHDFVDAVPIGLYGNDTRGDCVYVNQRACDLLDVSFDEALGLGWSKRLHPDDKARVLDSWRCAFSKREPWQEEFRFVHRNRRVVWVLARCVFTFDETGENTGSVGSLADITAQKDLEATLGEVNQHLQNLVNLDGLTQVPSRRYFDEYLVKEWFRLQESQQRMSVMMIDVDYFKAYNDTYGHVFGDRILKMVAQTIERIVKTQTSGIMARYGGEEFAAILPETSREEVLQAADAIVTAVRELDIPHEGSDVSERLTLSIGMTTVFPELAETPEGAIHEADIALYQAKQGGRNRAIAYSEAMGESATLEVPPGELA